MRYLSGVREVSRREVLAAGAALSIAALGFTSLTGATTAPAFAKPDSLRSLQRSIRGKVVRPGDPQYTALATPRNLRYAAMMPRAVILCADADDIAASIRWGRDTGTAFAIRGGGHNYIDASSSTGILITTRPMKRGTIKAGTLQIGAGALNSDLATLLAQGGAGTHLLPGGTCPNVGIAGLTLGGGIGPNAPWAGLSADRLRQAVMVTSTGDVVTTNSRTNPDLFWALRGGAGANFGVVTDLTYDMVEVPVTRATTFQISYSVSEATATGNAWQQVRLGNERIVSGTWGVYSSAQGARARLRAQVLLGEADARSLMAPMLGIPATSTEIAERSWWDAYAWYRTPISPSNTFWDRSLYADTDLPADVIEHLVSIVAGFPGVETGSLAFALAGWVGGAVSEVAPDATAYVHRPARTLVELTSGWPAPVDPKTWPTAVPSIVRAWMEQLWEVTLPHSTGGSYQNFPDPELPDPERSYYGPNLTKLRAVKSRWDPDNVFRYAQSIPPKPTSGADI